MIKNLIKRLLGTLGYRITPVRSPIWGVDWASDLTTLLGREEFSLRFSETPVLFDVGANEGQTATSLAKLFPSANIMSFEPVPTTYRTLRDNLAGIPNISTHAFGFGSTPGKHTINLYKSSVFASCYDATPAMSTKNEDYVGIADISLDTLDRFTSERRIHAIDLLKIDTEGYDCEVLRGASGLLSNRSIAAIVFEFFIVNRDVTTQGGALCEIDALLTENCYRPIGFYTDFVHPSVNMGVYNAMYIRSK